MKKTTSKAQALKNRSKLEWLMFVALLLIAYLWLANRYEWWPSQDRYNDKLGTAFYIPGKTGTKNLAASTATGASTKTTTEKVSNTSTTNSTNSTNGNNGNNGSNGSSSDLTILDLAANLDTGLTKQQLSVQANGLGEKCTVIANVPLLGKQEVCVYTQGDKVVTVTLLNDQVVSASRSGF